MLQKVTVGRWSLDAYEGIVPAEILAELRGRGKELSGRAHPESARPPTAAASQSCCAPRVPLLRDLGLQRGLEGDRRRPGLLPGHQGAA